MYEAIYPPYYKLGSAQILSPELIPEFKPGSQVIKAWIRERLYALDPYHPPNAFLTSLTQASCLALQFDHDDAAAYLRRIPSVMKYRPRVLLWDDNKSYVANYLLDTLQDRDEHALNKGVLFMKYVVAQVHPIYSH